MILDLENTAIDRRDLIMLIAAKSMDCDDNRWLLNYTTEHVTKKTLTYAVVSKDDTRVYGSPLRSDHIAKSVRQERKVYGKK